MNQTKMKTSYVVCYNESCRKHSRCFRWLKRRELNQHAAVVRCVNPHLSDENGQLCPLYQSNEFYNVARGMGAFYDEMPQKIASAIRRELINYYGNTLYYAYRNGDRAITPTMQAKIQHVCRKHGWESAPVYDKMCREQIWDNPVRE